MKISNIFYAGTFAVSTFLFAALVARADETDNPTKITFSNPIEIPGHVLPAGTYEFRADSDDLDLVRIFNADGTRLYASLRTVSAERPEPAEDTVVVLADQPDSGHVALIKWFYPGTTIGHEFVYSRQEEQQLAGNQQQTIDVK
jgi:hypothetical protein